MISNSLKISLHRIYRKIIFNLPFNYAPDFLIIGVQKAGTTTLFNLLIHHPKLKGSIIKEVHYFNRDDNYAKGDHWYRKNFKSLLLPSSGKLFFEATPEYIISPKYLERIKKFNPKIKVVIILRNPVDRAFSSWNFNKRFKEFSDILPDFEECVRQEMEVIEGKREENRITELRFLRKGLYDGMIENCFEIFGRSNVLIVMANDLKKKTIDLLNKVIGFVGLPHSNWDFLKIKNRNVGIYREKMEESTYKRLTEFYRDSNERLEKLLGHKLDW